MPVSMSFPLPFSMYGAIEDALRLSWAVRKKPLESFLLPAAAFSLPGGAGVLVCRDGSLVSLFRLDGARSMMGARELDGFVELGARRLNSVFTGPGHALHAVFERAPDEAERLVAAAGEQTLRQCERLGLALGDVIAERGRRLAPLMAAESFVIAAWTRPAVLAPDQVKRDRKRLRATAAPMAAGRRLLTMPVSGPRWPPAPARGLPRYPRGAVRRGRDHGRGAWRRRRVRHPAPVAERLGLDRTGLASGDGRQRRARAADRAARGWRVPAAAGAATIDPRSRADRRRNPHRRAALRGARHGARTAPGTSVLRTDGTPCRRRIALPLLGADRGRRALPAWIPP